MPYYENLARLGAILDKELLVKVDDKANSERNSHGYITVNNHSINTDQQFEMLTPEFFTGSSDNPIIKGYQELFRKLDILPKGSSPIPVLRDTPLRTKTVNNQDEQNRHCASFLNQILVANQWTMLFPDEYKDFRSKIAACYGKKPFSTKKVTTDPETGLRLASGGYTLELHQVNGSGLWLNLPESQEPKDIEAAIDKSLNNNENTILISSSLKKKLLEPQRLAFSIRGINRPVRNYHELANIPNGSGHQHLMIVDRTTNTIYAINSTKGASPEDYLVFKQQIELFLEMLGDKRNWKFEFIQGKSRQPDNQYTVQAQCNINQFISYTAIASGVDVHKLQDNVPSKVLTLMYLIQHAYINNDKALYKLLDSLLVKLNQQLFTTTQVAQPKAPVAKQVTLAPVSKPKPKQDLLPPGLSKVIERLQFGAQSYNPYWVGSQNKLNKILQELAKAMSAGQNLNQVLKNPNSDLSKAVNMRRLPSFNFFGEPAVAESRELVEKTTPRRA